MLHNSFYPLISRGQTSWSGRSVVCPLCDNVTPLTTSSFRSIRCTTFPFFYSPRFFSSPAISITSPTLGVPPLSLLSLWLSIKPHSYSLFQRFHSWALASSNRLVILVSFSVWAFSVIHWIHISSPQDHVRGSTSSSPPSASTYVGGLFWFLPTSMTTDSNAS